jgi:hypothetical protein
MYEPGLRSETILRHEDRPPSLHRIERGEPFLSVSWER